MAEEIERLNRWDVLETRKGDEHWGTILKERDDVIEFQPQESKEKNVFKRTDIAHLQRKGRPVLVGTVSIEKSERLGAMLERKGIKHEVLNAKHHRREAEIVAQAGRKSAVTIATNMAGRGTDIVLGGNAETMAWAVLQDKYETRLDIPSEEWDGLVIEIQQREKMKEMGAEVKQLGGLHVIGTERHDSRRIDLQLRGRCGRQGDPGSSRFFLSLEDDLMRIFAGEWVKGILDRLGMQEGEKIESRMVTRRIEAAQKKVEERNFEIRKNLLEYDEVMDEQRKRIYGYRQQILDGANCRELVLDALQQQVSLFITTFLTRDYGIDSFANWSGAQLATQFDGRMFRGLDFDGACQTARDEAIRMAETQVINDMEENLPVEEEPDEWNWDAMAKGANARWGLNLRDRDLKKIGRDHVAEMLIEKAQTAIEEVDLSRGEVMLKSDFGIRTTQAWVKNKFGLDLELDDIQPLEGEALETLICERARRAYDEKEHEYPVMAGLYRFTSGTGNSRIDRDQLVAWARDRFDAELTLDDLRNKQRDEIRAVLLQLSRTSQQRAEEAEADVRRRVDDLFEGRDTHMTASAVTGGDGPLASLVDWLNESLRCEFSIDDIGDLTHDELLQKTLNAVQDRYHPEMRRMERSLLLQIVDMAWKDHLLVMDHLRSSVGLKGYAQMDPKVEYKREGMKLFDSVWDSIHERTTDLVFKMEQLDEQFVGSTWVETSAVHEEASSASEIANEQEQAISSSQGERRVEPIRNRGHRVGRNEPCPCGSGKKYKACCMRKQDVA